MDKGFDRGLKFIRDLLFVPRCACCGERLNIFEDRKSMQNCRSALCCKCKRAYDDAKRKRCPFCGLAAEDCLCAPKLVSGEKCIMIKLLFYDPEHYTVASRMIYSMKHVNDSRVSEFAASELKEKIKKTNGADEHIKTVITWIPRSPKALHKNGFDQAEYLAKSLARELGNVKMAIKLIGRRNSREQKKLGADDRRANADRSIYLLPGARRALEGIDSVIIVDDLVTTGATLSRGIHLLRTVTKGNITTCVVAMTKGR